VIVNSENPVKELTLQQIADIYSGKITNWSEVGGEDRPIVKLSRETNSGHACLFS
jgi:phosphate transport system substrate-binding protein